MTADLLRTKLYSPSIRPDLVSRSHLIDKLNAGLLGTDKSFARKLTLVAAPAGYGKSTCVAEWLSSLATSPAPHADASSLIQVSWLSLDENDNDLGLFLSYLVAALQEVDERIGQVTQRFLAAPERPPLPALLGPLINDLAAASKPVLLVLDDYYLVSSLLVHQAVDFLLERQPATLHLVIATREDPPLQLSRLRVRGQMAEIRMNELRFNVPDSTQFLNEVMGLKLDSEQVSALATRTEGWVAGLQLAALSMRDRTDLDEFIQSFTGSNRYVLDFLVEEVLEQQPPSLQSFLLKTSILRRLSAPLCAAVTGEEDSPVDSHQAQSMLDQLDTANLFLISLDDKRQWYRYHHLFGSLLRNRLRLTGWDLLAFHQKAGLWLHENGFTFEAVPHALEASDWNMAADMLLKIADEMLEQGKVAALIGWLRKLPERVLRARPLLCLDYAWTLIFAEQLELAEEYLLVAEDFAENDPELLSEILTARVHMARINYDIPATIALSEQSLSLLPAGEVSSRGILSLNLGIAYWNSGQPIEAGGAFDAAFHAARQSGNTHGQLIAAGFLGLNYASLGELRRADELLQQTIADFGKHPGSALALRALGLIHYEWNEIDSAGFYLGQARYLAEQSAISEVLGGVFRQLALLKQQLGDDNGAQSILERADQLALDKRLSSFSQACNAACHVQIALAQNDLSTAVHWAEKISEPADASPFYPRLYLTPARLLLAQGEKAAAARELAECYIEATRTGWRYGLIETRVLQALAAADGDEALRFLADALHMARPQGYIRVFLDKGEPAVALLRQALADGIAPDYTAVLLGAFDGSPRSPGPVQGLPTGQLLEPLSEREMELLMYLVERRTNAEIARDLTISVNTVKSHLQHIYDKLNVHDRRSAVVKAGQLNLITYQE